MVNKDYYSILGIGRSSNLTEIRQAFRRRARELHPDKNQADPRAEEKFKDLGEAYRILSDPEKRKQYDLFGSVGGDYAPPPGWGGGAPRDFNTENSYADWEAFGGASFEEILDNFMNNFGARARRGSHRRTSKFQGERGSDVEVEMPVSVEDLFNLRPKQIRISTTRRCESCEGTGKTAGELCYECRGSTRVTHRKTLKIKLPPGLQQGQVIRIAGQGNPSPDGFGESGDLLIRVKLKPHVRYQITGSNLEINLEVPDYIAALGGKVKFQTPGEKMSLQLPAGTTSGKKLKIRGKGLPKRGGGFGDFLVNISVMIPAKPSKEQKELYKKLKNAGK